MHTFALVLFLMAIQTGQILSMPTVHDPAEVENNTPQALSVAKRMWDGDTTPLMLDYCIHYIHIMAFTSGKDHAQSRRAHAVEIRASGRAGSVDLYDRLGNDYYQHKGDLWKISITDFQFRGFSTNCLQIRDIDGIAIIESSNDGWNIESIVTLFQMGNNKYHCASADMEVNRWIDGDHEDESRKRFELSLFNC